ncbi:MAG: ParB/RepB/Spo0J family partition protein [Rhodothermia bacterium]
MAKKQVLGKGLGAILPSTAQEEAGESMSMSDATIYRFEDRTRGKRVAEIGLDQVRPNPFQPRDTFDEQSLAELAASIAEHGLIQPITVRVVGPKRYEIISGERRLRASRLAGLETIPGYIREAEDEDMLEWSLVENIQRQDLDPIELAHGFQRLIDECGLTQAQVAVKVGKDRSTVANALRLLRLPPSVQKALRTGQISSGHARVLVAVPDPELQVALSEEIISRGMSVRATEDFVRESGQKRSKSPRSKADPPTLTEAEASQIRDMTNRLRGRFGTQVAIRHESGNGGRIEIAYYSEEDLERIIELLLGLQ